MLLCSCEKLFKQMTKGQILTHRSSSVCFIYFQKDREGKALTWLLKGCICVEHAGGSYPVQNLSSECVLTSFSMFVYDFLP